MKYNVKRDTDGPENFFSSFFLLQILVYLLYVLVSFPFFHLILLSFFQVFQLIKFNFPFSSPLASLSTESQQAKLNALSAKERTNRQEIIFPLKSWLLSLLLTWQRSLLLWGQTVEVAHEYAHTHTHTFFRMVSVSAVVCLLYSKQHIYLTKTVWCWL